jgi:uncharacterized protein (DUF3820 family)
LRQNLTGAAAQARRSAAAAHVLDAKRLHHDPMNPEDLEKLVTREMPFGKYKGHLVADLPGSYLHWFARKGFPAGEIGRLLALMREIDHNGLKPMLEPLRRGRGPDGSVRED